MITLTEEDIATRSTEELIALGKALPHVMTIQVINFTGKPSIHESVDMLKKHTGGWVKKAHNILSAVPFPAVLTNLILEMSTDVKANEISAFLHPVKEETKARVLTSLESQLFIIENKAGELKTRGYDKAYNAANNLHTTLTQLKNQYCSGALEYPDFKKNSTDAVDAARIELKQHRGWKDLLGNVALCILGLGVGYLAVCLYKGSFFQFNTDSVNKLDVLQNNIDAAVNGQSLKVGIEHVRKRQIQAPADGHGDERNE